MLPHVLSMALADPSTSRQYWDNFTGYQYVKVLNLRWSFWCNKALNSLSPQYLADNCEFITTTGCRRLRSSNVPIPAKFQELAPSPSLLLVHVCRTVYHFISVTLNYHFLSFAGYWKRICLVDDPSALWLISDIVRFTNVFTYLLKFEKNRADRTAAVWRNQTLTFSFSFCFGIQWWRRRRWRHRLLHQQVRWTRLAWPTSWISPVWFCTTLRQRRYVSRCCLIACWVPSPTTKSYTSFLHTDGRTKTSVEVTNSRYASRLGSSSFRSANQTAVT